MDPTTALGEGIAAQLGIEVRPPRPRPAQAASPEAPDTAALLSNYVGIDLPPPKQAECWAAPADRAIDIADRVAAGESLSEDDRAFLWTDRELVSLYSRRLDLARAVAQGGGR